MLEKFLSVAITRTPANVAQAFGMRWSKTKPYAAAISTEELRAVRATAATVLSRADIEGLLRALRAARAGAPESLLSQAGTVAALLRAEVLDHPAFFARLLHEELFRAPGAVPYAEVVSTETIADVLSSVAESLSDSEAEGLARAVLPRGGNPGDDEDATDGEAGPQ